MPPTNQASTPGLSPGALQDRFVAFDSETLKQCWFLAGPTACGKTKTGLSLAEKLGAEILSLDSMAIYRGMDIGTAKPTVAERQQILHHLLDLADPSEDFSVASYLAHAEAAVQDILTRNRVPLFVGGTGLYLRSLLRGLFDGPGSDPVIRSALEAEAARIGGQALHDRLAQLDPSTAARLHPNDQRRIIRALEVAQLTGRALSSFHEQAAAPHGERPAHVYWLSPPREWLYGRIDQRVDQMMSNGLLAETERLLTNPNGLGRTARQALGYREILEHLAGKRSLPDTIALIKQRTRQFAKRQLTWFRNLEECHPIEITGAESAEQLADRITAAG